MSNGLSALHNAHDCRLALKVAVFRHAFVGLFVFLLGLLELDLVDAHAILGMREGQIDGEVVPGVDVFARRLLREWAQLGTCQ